MKNILITGGTSGLGKALALHYLSEGEHVIVVGNSPEKGAQFLLSAKQLNAEHRAKFIKADLSLISENKRLIRQIEMELDKLDLLILSAAYQKQIKQIRLTTENNEFVFGLMYLSRYILSYGLTNLLTKSNNPTIVNVAAPGMKGMVNWQDLQFKNDYNSQKVKFHTSRLNDLLGVGFSKKMKYILYNPWAVKSENALNASNSRIANFFTKIVYGIIGKTPEDAMIPLIREIENNDLIGLSAYKLDKRINLNAKEYDPDNAIRLRKITEKLVENY
ncbi:MULTISPECIES: SDR family oxidoreductase [Enterococcus]|uniref:SDR family oxidoreductase n=1 Tax=Enterococcus TaxID=1350 RepID=UPI0002A1C511|nr:MULTISPECIES: SDR family oxidoreductase [Enterococcus]ELB05485.1 hypothetical protein OIG_04366 [Enterococcus faecium EnGen0028]MDT6323804.1 SDR family oxidoreductase [Enterococcus faecium]HAQ4672467.1 SDR family oxidoreductase [Enterococcus faecium]HAQ4706616.1 SDR family oxidoreductase [Enterococcus faecium]HAR1638582.1 SDR family oxidoreductase [Enterococcus faecium]